MVCLDGSVVNFIGLARLVKAMSVHNVVDGVVGVGGVVGTETNEQTYTFECKICNKSVTYSHSELFGATVCDWMASPKFAVHARTLHTTVNGHVQLA